MTTRDYTKFALCPRCGDDLPPYPGAMSRNDNRTEVCSACGVAEALKIGPMEKWGWWINLPAETQIYTQTELDVLAVFTAPMSEENRVKLERIYNR